MWNIQNWVNIAWNIAINIFNERNLTTATEYVIWASIGALIVNTFIPLLGHPEAISGSQGYSIVPNIRMRLIGAKCKMGQVMDDLVRRLFDSLLGVWEYACGLVVGPNCVVSDEIMFNSRRSTYMSEITNFT